VVETEDFLRGFGDPFATGGLRDGESNDSTVKTFLVATSTGTLPLTVVMAVTSNSGDRSARISARASSMPGSVSMMTRLDMGALELSIGGHEGWEKARGED